MMNEPDNISEALKDLVDSYLDGTLDEAGYQDLEVRLRSDPKLLTYFVRYCRLHTDLALETRAGRAGERLLRTLDLPQTRSASGLRPSRFWSRPLSLASACLLLVAFVGSWHFLRQRDDVIPREESIVWLVNAQDCKWIDRVEPGGNFHVGKRIRIERGLAEFQFRSGVSLILEGPAELEALSANSARLHHGKLTARVPDSATGFTVWSPKGKVIDLGTEFGVAVADDGTTDVRVFEGKVQAYATDQAGNGVFLKKDQSARVNETRVVLDSKTVPADASSYVRAIVPPPILVPRNLALDFRQSVLSSIRDKSGHGTGLTHRLPGTGSVLPKDDPNLDLELSKGRLELTTTNSDINTQFQLNRGEYLGVRLSDLGFTGNEDFEVAATIPNIPALHAVGQFGLYAGLRSDNNIRGGVISRKEGAYTQFLVNNKDGRDANLNMVGLLTPGNDLKLSLKRLAGKYSLTIENQSTGGASALTIRPSDSLVGAKDLYVGLFGANTQSDVRGSLVVTDFKATVWTTKP